MGSGMHIIKTYSTWISNDCWQRASKCQRLNTELLEIPVFAMERIEELEEALRIAGEEIEAYLGYCPAEQENVPWDCEKKCSDDVNECSARCWTDWFKHKQALKGGLE